MFYRTFVLLAALALPSASLAQTPGPRTADDAVADALARPSTAAATKARLRAARARIADATVTPVPVLGLDYEQVFGDEVGYLELSTTVSQQLDLTGWRGRLRESLPHQAAGIEADADQWRLDAATTVRTAFYEVRYRQARGAVLDAWLARIDAGLANLEAREARGDASAYAVARLRRERAIVRSDRARERALEREAWAGLRAWTRWEEVTLTGALAPPRPTGEPAPLPALVALEARARALGAEAAAWGDPGLRGWSLGAGYRFARANETTGHGVIVNLSVPLALWNTDAARVEALVAERAGVEAELAIERAFATRAEVAARARLGAALEALEDTPSDDADLTAMAEAAFRAGEATLTELLDAYQSEAELHLTRVDLAWEARRAAIDLDRRRGVGAPR